MRRPFDAESWNAQRADELDERPVSVELERLPGSASAPMRPVARSRWMLVVALAAVAVLTLYAVKRKT